MHILMASRARAGACLGAAFALGVLLAIGLERTRRRRLQRADEPRTVRGPPAIVDGIEGCIGNTPLLRIKSLSEATGCEILGKAEVWDA